MLFVRSIFDEKSDPKFKLWYKPNCEFEDDEIIFHAKFGKKKTHDSNEIAERVYYLTKTCIFYKKSEDDPKVRGVLSLKMTRLHYTELDEPVWKDYKYSLTFVRNKKFTEIFTDNGDVFKDWIHVLRLLTIQTDFHLRYKVIKMIGQGSFARVYLAKNNETDEKVAIKAFNKEHILKKDKGVENIREEIEITWNLNNKNLIKMIELHESENSIYMILELLEGGEIFKLSGGCIQYDMAIHIIRELLKGVGYLARHGIMHRDLKPENIVLKYLGKPLKDNSLKIVDFGLSAYKDDQPHCFVKCGTPGYAAPEVINCTSNSLIPYDTKCDIFSLGIIFFFMITGVMPYDGADFMEVMANNKKGTINFDIPELKAQPDIVMQLLRGMLEMDPKKRLSAEEALKSPIFEEGAIKDINKFSSVEDLDSQLRKFKDKFKKRSKKGDQSSMQFNTHPDMQNGIQTYANLSENQSTGSNRNIFSIDNSGANTPENKSAKGSSRGNLADPKKNQSMLKYTLMSSAQGNMIEGFTKGGENKSFDDKQRSSSREDLAEPKRASLSKMASADAKNDSNFKELTDKFLEPPNKSKFADTEEDFIEEDD